MKFQTYKIQVYKIYWKASTLVFYIGSTKNNISKRMTAHKSSARNGRETKLYSHIRDNGYDFKWEVLETHTVSSFAMQRAFEQDWINNLSPILNLIKSYS